jgi:hypothetical protein
MLYFFFFLLMILKWNGYNDGAADAAATACYMGLESE